MIRKRRVEVRSQAEFDACVAAGNIAVVTNCCVEARGSSSVVAWDSSTVVARDSSTVVAWENSSVVAWENSSVVAWENSSVEAWENSSVVARDSSTVVAWENSSVEAWENSSVVARGHVFVRLFSALRIRVSLGVVIMRHRGATWTRVEGKATVIDAFRPATAAEWCEHYGVEVKDGVATVYKGVHDDFRSDHKFDYTPGTTPVAPDWDGGNKECGKGLHFSPTPRMAHEFTSGRRYLACRVALADMRPPGPNDCYPQKIKAKGCCAPVIECDVKGKEIAHVVA